MAKTWTTETGQNMRGSVRISKMSSDENDNMSLVINYEFKGNGQTPLDVFYWKEQNETLPSVCYQIENDSEF